MRPPFFWLLAIVFIVSIVSINIYSHYNLYSHYAIYPPIKKSSHLSKTNGLTFFTLNLLKFELLSFEKFFLDKTLYDYEKLLCLICLLLP